MRLQMILDAVDRATGPITRVRAAIGRVAGDGDRLARIQDRLTRSAGRLGTALGTLAGGLMATASAGAIGTMMLASRFEQFGVVLEQTEGSRAKAQNALRWIRGFAADTPFELEQVTEAFVRLRAYGIDPTDGTLRTLGDTASGMGKHIMDAIEMVADAQTGEFERLKEFGVRASAEGDRVTFRWQKNGREMSTSSTKSASDIRRALMGIFNERFGGMMAKQSRTLAGMLSNIKDRIAGFGLDVADAGAFNVIKGKLEELLRWVDAVAKDGRLERWAKQASDGISKLVGWLASINWVSVAQDIAAIAGALWSFATAIASIGGGGLDGLFNAAVFFMIGRIAFGLYGLAAALGVVSVAGAPLWLVVGVIALIAAAAYMVWRKWDVIAAFFSDLWARISETFSTAWQNLVAGIDNMWARAKGAFLSGVALIWAALPAWIKGVITGASFVMRLVTGGASPPPGVAPSGAGEPGRPTFSRPAVGQAAPSRVALDIRTAPGTSARVASASGPVSVSGRRTGRAMGGVATA